MRWTPFSPCRASPAMRAARWCIVLSDGLERGDPSALMRAVGALAARAWRLDWLTPLAAEPRLPPADRGAGAILPLLDASSMARSTRGDLPARSRPVATEGARDEPPWLRRCPSSHLAAGTICPGCSGRCSRASSVPTSRSGATIRSRNISPTSPAPASRRSVYVQTNWAKTFHRRGPPGSADAARETGWPHAIVAYADLTRTTCARNWNGWRDIPLVRGVRMQLHWHENAHVSLRRAAGSVRAIR